MKEPHDGCSDETTKSDEMLKVSPHSRMKSENEMMENIKLFYKSFWDLKI